MLTIDIGSRISGLRKPWIVQGSSTVNSNLCTDGKPFEGCFGNKEFREKKVRYYKLHKSKESKKEIKLCAIFLVWYMETK